MTKLSVVSTGIGLLIGVALGGLLVGNRGATASDAHATGSAEVTTAAESVATATRPPRVHHILLEVSNMRASLIFYRDMMGLIPRSEGSDFTILRGANVDIYLSTNPWTWKEPRGKDERLGLGMYPHVEVEKVKDAVDRFRKAGYTIVQEPRDYYWGTEAFVADPDGYTWSLISLPRKSKDS